MALTQTYSSVAEDGSPMGGQFSDADINAYVQANIGNPQAIADAAQQYGVSPERLSQATGYDMGTVNSYFGNAGINMWGQPADLPPVSAPVDYAAQQFQPESYSAYEPEYMGRSPQQETSPVAQTPPPVAQTPPPAATGYGTSNVTDGQNTGIASLGGASLGAGLPGASAPTVQATTPAPVTPPPPTPPFDINSVNMARPEETKYGTVTPYTTSQIKDYITGVYGDATLAPWQQTNKVMEAAQKAGISQDDLRSIYGKDVVDPYLKTYGTGIKDYITTTLGDKTQSDFDRLAAINQAANKYGLDANEIAQYSGLNKTGVDKMFTAFDTGLTSIVKNLSAPTVSDLDKTKGALALQQKYNISDDQIAKALGGNVTGKDVAAYLAPVKNFNTDLQAITADPSKTAQDLQSFIDNAKKDPRIEGLYGLAIDKVQKAVPILGLRDSLAGNGTPEQLAKGYTDFVAAVNADPALRQQYGAQADAIKKVADMSQRIADEKYGGKLQPHMFQTFIGLDQKTMTDVPKQLETTKPETRTVTDNEGQTQTYTIPGQVKDTKGLEPVYNIIGSGENETRELVGYTKPVKTSAGVIVDAQYDANGTLTGYRGRPEDKVWPQHRVGITGVWDAEGKAKPEQRVETPGFAKSVLQDVAELGPIGQIALMAATGGLGSLVSGSLQGALGSTLAKAVGSGLVGGTLAEIGGGKFGKGFATGALGNVGSNLIANNMPTFDTGNAAANQYLAKALPNLASSTIGAAINKQDIGKAGLGSLINTGTNMATSSLINSAMPDTLTPEMQKMFTGVSGQLLSSLLQGQTPDMQKAIMGTIMQNAMSPSKTTAKEKG